MRCCHVCRSSLLTCLESGNCPCHWEQQRQDNLKGTTVYADTTGNTAVNRVMRRDQPKRNRQNR